MQMKVDALWVPLARHPNATHKAVRIALLPIVNPKNLINSSQNLA